MATSSIFHNIIITDPEDAEAFLAACEASERDPWIRPDVPMTSVNTDRELTRRMIETSLKRKGLK